MHLAIEIDMSNGDSKTMSLFIAVCCRPLHTGVGFGKTPVRPLLIVQEGDPRKNKKI